MITDQSGVSAQRVEVLLRASRRALVVLCVAILWLGSTALAVALRPGSLLAIWPLRAPWLFPVAMIGAWGALRASMHWQCWRADAPEVAVIEQDELRRASLSRAQRWALIVVLVAQVPLGVALLHVPGPRAVLGMAGGTIALGMTTVIAAFLFLDRE